MVFEPLGFQEDFQSILELIAQHLLPPSKHEFKKLKDAPSSSPCPGINEAVEV